jgi:gliding motility-associated-like protein
MRTGIALLIVLMLGSAFIISGCKKARINRKACKSKAFLFKENDSTFIFIPNVFTPNGDAINDLFRPRMNNISTFQLDIKTRFKRQVFSIFNQQMSWDGSYQNKIKDEIYCWVLTATTSNGTSIVAEGEVACINPSGSRKYQPKNCEDCIFPDQFSDKTGEILYKHNEIQICR